MKATKTESADDQAYDANVAISLFDSLNELLGKTKEECKEERDNILITNKSLLETKGGKPLRIFKAGKGVYLLTRTCGNCKKDSNTSTLYDAMQLIKPHAYEQCPYCGIYGIGKVKGYFE